MAGNGSFVGGGGEGLRLGQLQSAIRLLSLWTCLLQLSGGVDEAVLAWLVAVSPIVGKFSLIMPRAVHVSLLRKSLSEAFVTCDPASFSQGT